MATPVTFDELFTLEPAGDDTFRAISAEYPWGQVYGGQVAAQGLLAAGLTTELVYEPHSLHAYFVRIGNHDEPIESRSTAFVMVRRSSPGASWPDSPTA